MRAAALGLSALVLVMALAGCSSNVVTYPKSYMLEGDEIPDGLRLSDPPPEWPIDNPGRVPAEFLRYAAEEFEEFRPDDAWVELLEPNSGNGGVLIAAAFWTDITKAEAAVQAIKTESDGEVCNGVDGVGGLLRDGQVVVLYSGDDMMQPHMGDVLKALQKGAPGLQDICA